MLSGICLSTAGQARLNGYWLNSNDHRQQDKLRQSIGYCPQSSAIFPKLTVNEHLVFYAKLKGINVNVNNKSNLIEQLMTDLALINYKHRQAGRLSYGNQRKLSVAIALIGNPPIVMLDEPSSGMDPVSKRKLWTYLASSMKKSGRSVILTSHSMEECEVLCDRIGIMINGQFVCLGNNTHLKHKFGHGFQLDLKFKLNSNSTLVEEEQKEQSQREQIDGEELSEFDNVQQSTLKLKQEFGDANVDLIEDYVTVARYQIRLNLNPNPNHNRRNSNSSDISNIGDDENKIDNEENETGSEVRLQIGELFRRMESIKSTLPIVNYAISQTSLEQIFVRFAQQQINRNLNLNVNNDEDNNNHQFVDQRTLKQKLLAECISVFA
jgi:ATP-binding cassette subfamily A (ABC1) protein 1